mgnify:FL=1
MKEKFESLLTRIKDLEAKVRFLETEVRMLTGRC